MKSPKDWLALIVAVLMGTITIYVLLVYQLLFAHHNNTQPWQVGPGGRGWVPTVKGYSEPTIKQISVF